MLSQGAKAWHPQVHKFKGDDPLSPFAVQGKAIFDPQMGLPRPNSHKALDFWPKCCIFTTR